MTFRKLSHWVVAGVAVLSLGFWGCSDNTLAPLSNEDVASQHAVAIHQPQNGDPIPGQYIVVMKPDQKTGSLRAAEVETHARHILADNGISESKLNRVYSTALQGFVATGLTVDQADGLARDARVDYVEQDKYIILKKPSNPGGGGGGGGGGQTTPWGITRVGGPSTNFSGDAWIIDTGIDLDHGDLNVDVNRSWSAFTSGRDATPDDLNGHGTHVAGTVAAIDNEQDVVGVAPGATVIAVKVLNRRGSGSTSGVIAGVDYAAANFNTGDVANMSLGGGVSTALDQAVINAAQAGLKFALAAGNEGQDADNSSPGRANHARIWTVSAIDSNDGFAYFSNWGNPPVDFAAPGVSILSLAKGGGTTTMSGTSMASPHVCGLLLLGNISTDGYAVGDPDGNPDPIAHN
ncbi:MAG: S8 family peptidase [Gemmatimonadetes bacterium]|nr:MAG: S8 family peptidase [Gemmatimonadota bacterium]